MYASIVDKELMQLMKEANNVEETSFIQQGQ